MARTRAPAVLLAAAAVAAGLAWGRGAVGDGPAPATPPAPVAPPPAAPPPGPQPSPPTAPDAASPLVLGTFRLAPTPVVDADTLKLDEPRESVRVLGVDAEEVFHKPEDREAAARDFAAYAKAMRGDAARPRKYGTPAGEAAKAFAQAWFAGVTEVRLELDEPGRDRDGFGRRLAHVFATKDGREQLFAEVLLRAGWAPYFVKYGRSPRFDARFKAAQAAARAEKLGIWSDGVAHYPDYDERLTWWEGRAAQVDAWAADVTGPTPPPNPIRLGVPAETARLATLLGQRVTLFASLDRLVTDREPRRMLFVDAPNRPFAVVVLDPKVWSALDLPAVEARFARVSGTVSEYRGRLQVVLEKAEDLSTR
ncbi:MAG: thermonuclease family protein [Planctomycetota bacterium]